MPDGGPDQVMVPVEGGENGLRCSALYNERKPIERRKTGRRRWGRKRKRGRQGGTRRQKARVRPCHQCPLAEQFQERRLTLTHLQMGNCSSYLTGLLWEWRSPGCECTLSTRKRSENTTCDWLRSKTSSWRGGDAREGSWLFSPYWVINKL